VPRVGSREKEREMCAVGSKTWVRERYRRSSKMGEKKKEKKRKEKEKKNQKAMPLFFTQVQPTPFLPIL
jgi:hypothetical protein